MEPLIVHLWKPGDCLTTLCGMELQTAVDYHVTEAIPKVTCKQCLMNKRGITATTLCAIMHRLETLELVEDIRSAGQRIHWGRGLD